MPSKWSAVLYKTSLVHKKGMIQGWLQCLLADNTPWPRHSSHIRRYWCYPALLYYGDQIGEEPYALIYDTGVGNKCRISMIWMCARHWLDFMHFQVVTLQMFLGRNGKTSPTTSWERSTGIRVKVSEGHVHWAILATSFAMIVWHSQADILIWTGSNLLILWWHWPQSVASLQVSTEDAHSEAPLLDMHLAKCVWSTTRSLWKWMRATKGNTSIEYGWCDRNRNWLTLCPNTHHKKQMSQTSQAMTMIFC